MRKLVGAMSLGLLLGACSTGGSGLPYLSIYRLDINQGNYVTQDQVEKLKVGQTRQTVKAILGTPLVADPFHATRWDYVYEFRRQGEVVTHRTFTAYFVDEKLARWEGDEMPASQADLNREALARTSSESRWGEERSWWDSIVDIFKK